MIRTTLALLVAMAAVAAAALWTARRLDADTVTAAVMAVGSDRTVEVEAVPEEQTTAPGTETATDAARTGAGIRIAAAAGSDAHAEAPLGSGSPLEPTRAMEASIAEPEEWIGPDAGFQDAGGPGDATAELPFQDPEPDTTAAVPFEDPEPDTTAAVPFEDPEPDAMAEVPFEDPEPESVEPEPEVFDADASAVRIRRMLGVYRRTQVGGDR